MAERPDAVFLIHGTFSHNDNDEFVPDPEDPDRKAGWWQKGSEFVAEMDRCWLERRFDDLSAYIADNIVLVAPGGEPRIEGLAASIESYREFMRRCEVGRFETRDVTVTRRADTAVVEYAWDMAWTDHDEARAAHGREVLVLARGRSGWRVVWRTQLPA